MKRRIFVILIALVLFVCVFAACGAPTVTFVAQNGTETRTEVVFDDLSKVPVFQNGDKVFDGWFKDADCTAGNEWIPTLDVSGNITVYAKWKDAEPEQLKDLFVIVLPETGKITLPKDNASEDELKAQIIAIGIKEDDSRIVLTDYTLQNFDASVINREQTVTVSYGELSKTIVVTVVDNNIVDSSVLEQVFNFYANSSGYNFQIKYSTEVDGDVSLKTLNYLAGNVQFVYDFDGETYTEYYVYSAKDDAYFYYEDDGDGNYSVLTEDDFFFEYYALDVDCVFLTELSKLQFLEGDDCYVAADAQDAGDAILGEWEECTWLSLEMYVSNNKIVKIVAVQEDVSEEYAGIYTYTLEFGKYGQIAFTIPTAGSDDPDNPDMPDEAIEATISEALAVGNALAKNAETAEEYSITGVIGSIDNLTYGNGKLVDATNSNISINIYGMYSSDGSLRYDKMGNDAPKAGDTVTLVGKIKNYNGTIEIINAKVVSLSQGTTHPSAGTLMPAQSYNAATFDTENMQDKISGEGYAIGLPSKGEYSALVVPVQFSDHTLTPADLEKLNKAFNGTGADTGWESVSSYYNKSSYGMLNLSFDIWGVNLGTKGTPYVSARNSAYYESYKKTVKDEDGENYTQYGDEALLLEVLAYLQNNGVDLDKYDTNDDGMIDAVYIIYSAPVNYDDDDSMWWAYVTWYYGTETFGDNEISPYYYLFAGFDFMNEYTSNDEVYDSKYQIDGLTINASTYIHESGHLLGLDDYYDNDAAKGSNRGLGGADMMDATVGDHCVYSKIMLGWLAPTIITTTQTFTIDLSDNVTSNDCVMLLLNSDNSYFCEYLLIDLYSATGVNELYASQKDSYLYGGASFGARIYHVTSWCTDGFIDYNNSDTTYALIKLVEADGENSKTTQDDGAWAASSDLWQTGDALEAAFPAYTRNDGKVVNFDVTFDSVTATSATITVTFAAYTVTSAA